MIIYTIVTSKTKHGLSDYDGSWERLVVKRNVVNKPFRVLEEADIFFEQYANGKWLMDDPNFVVNAYNAETETSLDSFSMWRVGDRSRSKTSIARSLLVKWLLQTKSGV